MSDRAEVALAIKIEAYKETITQEVKKCLEDCDAVYKVGEDFDYYLFYWDSVKWNPSFEEVKTINSYVEECLKDGDYAIKVLWPQYDNDCDDDRGSPSDFDIYVRYEIQLPDDKTLLNKEEFFSSNAEKFINKIT